MSQNLNGTHVTRYLQLATDGDEEARNHAYQLVHEELRRIAQRNMTERDIRALRVTAVVDDAYLRLVCQANIGWNDRRHFFAFACQTVRKILVDHARHRTRQKRGAGLPEVPLEAVAETQAEAAEDLQSAEQMLALDQALTRLEAEHPELAMVVQLHHFGGWDHEQIGREILNVSLGTVKRRWASAKAMLHQYMTEADNHGV